MSALAHPAWAYTGALLAPVAVGALVGVARSSGVATPSPWWLVAGLGLAAVGAHYYMNRAEDGSRSQEFAEGIALSTGPVAIGLAALLLFSPSVLAGA